MPDVQVKKCHNGCPGWADGKHKFSCEYARRLCDSQVVPHPAHLSMDTNGVLFRCMGVE